MNELSAPASASRQVFAEALQTVGAMAGTELQLSDFDTCAVDIDGLAVCLEYDEQAQTVFVHAELADSTAALSRESLLALLSANTELHASTGLALSIHPAGDTLILGRSEPVAGMNAQQLAGLIESLVAIAPEVLERLQADGLRAQAEPAAVAASALDASRGSMMLIHG